jgi:hypothetical protein
MQFGICERCYQSLTQKTYNHFDIYMRICVQHKTSSCAIPLTHILSFDDIIDIFAVLDWLEEKQYIKTLETLQDIFILPQHGGKHENLDVFCSNQHLGCAKKVIYKEKFIENN